MQLFLCFCPHLCICIRRQLRLSVWSLNWESNVWHFCRTLFDGHKLLPKSFSILCHTSIYQEYLFICCQIQRCSVWQGRLEQIFESPQCFIFLKRNFFWWCSRYLKQQFVLSYYSWRIIYRDFIYISTLGELYISQFHFVFSWSILLSNIFILISTDINSTSLLYIKYLCRFYQLWAFNILLLFAIFQGFRFAIHWEVELVLAWGHSSYQR